MNSGIKKAGVGVGCLFLLAGFLRPSPEFSLGGYFKNFLVAFDPPEIFFSGGALYPDRLMGLVSSRLRLQAFLDISRRLRFSAAYDLSPRVQDPFLFQKGIFFTGVDPYGYRIADLNDRIFPREKKSAESFVVFQNLDRAVLSLTTGPADIYIGRQAIAWGSARVINPTDVIAPFALQEFDKEERVGVDAVRVRIPLGFMGEIDAGYVFGRDFHFSRSAFFLRTKFYAAATDISLLLLGFRENMLIGLDVARSIGGAGFWLEGAYVAADAFPRDESAAVHDYIRMSTGLDYSFSGKTYGFIEYHFNSGGARNPGNYLANLSRPSMGEGSVFLMGRHYLIPGLNYQITPLITLTAEVLFNLEDGSFFAAPLVEYNLAANVYVAVGGFVGLGKSPVSPSGSDPSAGPVLRSEFGSYAEALYSSVRIYF